MSTPTIANPPLGKATDFLRNYGAIIGMIIVLLIFYWLKPAFLSPANIANVLRQSTILIILALGLTVVMSMRGVDLSIAQVADAAGLMAAILIIHGQPVWMAFTLPLVFGLVIPIFAIGTAIVLAASPILA